MTESLLAQKLKDFNIILASGSPRRQQFFKDLGLPFEIRFKEVPEEYPDHLRASEIPVYLARLKADAFGNSLAPNELLITSDTIVWHRDKCLGKPTEPNDAKVMLQKLSGDEHEVITAVCFTSSRKRKSVYCSTTVRFRELTTEEIQFYVSHYNPMDKAGGYGIQEWIGLIGIERINGSYFNVMGLPTHLVYQTLLQMVQ